MMGVATINRALLAGLVTCGFLAACSSGDTPEPDATSTDGPRSIFQGDGENGEGTQVAPAALRPLETTISFADGTPDLTEAARAELATIIDSPQMDAGGAIVLRGHSDSEGSDEANLEASRLKAEAVRDFLVENGVAAERIEVIAFGEQNPIAPNALPDGSPNEEGRATNRRVEVTVETGRTGERRPSLIETLTEPEEKPPVSGDAKVTTTPTQ